MISESDSDFAPLSSLVDLPTSEYLKQKEARRLQRSVFLASSASEDESGDPKKSNKNESKLAFITKMQKA